MSKRKPMDKAQARERRNQLLESAASADLSLTEGVREMRAIAGMTQDEFAQHRGVSARVIKAIELGQGNPTVATLNRIGEFFGLEVGFVPVRRAAFPAPEPQQNIVSHSPHDQERRDAINENFHGILGRELIRILNEPDFQRKFAERLQKELTSETGLAVHPPVSEQATAIDDRPPEKKKKSRTR
jgi:DNA-binding XRE family transcriptional regulator